MRLKDLLLPANLNYFQYTGTLGTLQPIGSAGSVASSSSVSVTHGSNPKTPGNLLIVSFYSGNNSVTVNTPVGWTRVVGGWGAAGTMWTFFRQVQVGEAASYNFTFSGSATVVWSLNEFSGVQNVHPEQVVVSTTTGTLNELVLPAITIDKPSLIYVLMGNSGTAPIEVVYPGGFQKGAEQTRCRHNYQYYGTAFIQSPTIICRPVSYPATLNAFRAEAYKFLLA